MTDDLTIRSATPADVDAIAALIADRLDDEDAAEARIVLEDPTFDMSRWTVATAGDRIVSTMASFAAEAVVGAAEIPATMIELVATAREHEAQGLVKRQLETHHHHGKNHHGRNRKLDPRIHRRKRWESCRWIDRGGAQGNAEE